MLRRILLIARRDFLAVVMTKPFVFGLFVLPVLLGGGFFVQVLNQKRDNAEIRKVAVLDRSGVAGPYIIQAAQANNKRDLFDKLTGRQVMPQYEFQSIPAAPGDAQQQLLALSDRVRRRELYAFVDIPPNVLQPQSPPSAGAVHFYSAAGGIDTFRGWLAAAVNQGLLQTRMKQSRIPPAELAALLSGVPVESMNLISRNAQTGAILPGRKKGAVESFAVPYVLVMLLTMLVLLSSNPMLTTVAQDKLQRVFEMMLSSASPWEIIAGKVLATVGTSLISSALYILGGIIALEGMGMFKLIPFGALPWFFVYLVAEVTMMCALGAALGSSCSSPQDAQQLAILLMMPMIIPLFLLTPVLQQPGGAMATGLSLFPLFTPLLMLVRQSMPDGVPFWQPWVGLVGVLACTLMGTWAAARIFRIGILSQGATPKPAELVRWAIRG